eukprot:CAMPEP_0204823502 /NCGR_PEP_ID=MMETSP1346-20131115/1577_1 /ASSEMBLY_ACC=CAM_ASM_000771 /TAXON_ID=215587 /ORGANISM="Aplanochytrium stocchinoi, Strain GSBS06" /LENGTH=387 /DNA_ID=CAMNT_0051950167 /DNA_START=151 /DNA_END=1314 /DNA_ORIENTATION=-
MLKRALLGTTGGAAAFLGACLYKQDEWTYANVLMPVVQIALDGEDAHRWGVWAASKNLFPKCNFTPTRSLMETKVWDLTFPNPLGMAAGFDKDGEGVEGIARLGFGFVEVGSVTPLPQPGNARPRVFRLYEDKAVINRYGFNSAGHEKVLQNVSEYIDKKRETPCILGINLGKNKTSSSAVDDYSKGVNTFFDVADYLVVNVSSPNTPGLRNLQAKKELSELISGVTKARDLKCKDGSRCTPLLLKIAPDLTEEDKLDIADVVLVHKVDGLIVANTTVSRPDSLLSSNKNETGGLSGAPLKNLSTTVIRDMYKLTNGKIPIIGVGGVSNGADALEKIKAGASLVQVYSALTYQGPPLAKKILQELEELLKRIECKNVSELIGIDVEL